MADTTLPRWLTNDVPQPLAEDLPNPPALEPLQRLDGLRAAEALLTTSLGLNPPTTNTFAATTTLTAPAAGSGTGTKASKRVAQKKPPAVRLAVGTSVRVLWPRDRQWHVARVHKFDPKKALHTLVTDHGDSRRVDLRSTRWEPLHPAGTTATTSSSCDATPPIFPSPYPSAIHPAPQLSSSPSLLLVPPQQAATHLFDNHAGFSVWEQQQQHGDPDASSSSDEESEGHRDAKSDDDMSDDMASPSLTLATPPPPKRLRRSPCPTAGGEEGCHRDQGKSAGAPSSSLCLPSLPQPAPRDMSQHNYQPKSVGDQRPSELHRDLSLTLGVALDVARPAADAQAQSQPQLQEGQVDVDLCTGHSSRRVVGCVASSAPVGALAAPTASLAAADRSSLLLRLPLALQSHRRDGAGEAVEDVKNPSPLQGQQSQQQQQQQGSSSVPQLLRLPGFVSARRGGTPAAPSPVPSPMPSPAPSPALSPRGIGQASDFAPLAMTMAPLLHAPSLTLALAPPDVDPHVVGAGPLTTGAHKLASVDAVKPPILSLSGSSSRSDDQAVEGDGGEHGELSAGDGSEACSGMACDKSHQEGVAGPSAGAAAELSGAVDGEEEELPLMLMMGRKAVQTLGVGELMHVGSTGGGGGSSMKGQVVGGRGRRGGSLEAASAQRGWEEEAMLVMAVARRLQREKRQRLEVEPAY